jgi:hypothetical protein
MLSASMVGHMKALAAALCPALPGVEVRSEARSMRSESRGSHGRLAEPELSSTALDRMARQAAALALSDSDGVTEAAGTPPASQPAGSGRPPVVAQALTPPQQQPSPPPQAQQQEPPQQGVAQPTAAAQQQDGAGAKPLLGTERMLGRELTLSYPGGIELPVEPTAAPSGRPPPHSAITFRASPATSPGRGDADSSGLGHAESDAATRGSVHHRTASVGSVGGQRSVHYKSMSTESVGRGEAAVRLATKFMQAVCYWP